MIKNLMKAKFYGFFLQIAVHGAKFFVMQSSHWNMRDCKDQSFFLYYKMLFINYDRNKRFLNIWFESIVEVMILYLMVSTCNYSACQLHVQFLSL